MLPVQCKMARVALGLSLIDLAKLAEVAPATISRLESGKALKPRTLRDIRQTLETAGVIFIDENGDGAGVRLKKADS